MKQSLRITATYSVIHFLVDFSSIAVLTGLVLPSVSDKSELILCMLLYNAFAFAFQLPLGVFGDYLDKNALLATFGCALVGAACFIPNIFGICVAAGLGNACFHVGGGIDVLNISNHKATLPGIFVAPGAFGLFLSVLAVNKGFKSFYLLTFLMLLCAAVLLGLYETMKNNYRIHNTVPVVDLKFDGKKLAMATLLVGTILLRSYMGTLLNYGFKTKLSLAALFVTGIVLGKALGGIIGDRFGWLKTGAVTLSLASVLFVFSFKSPAAAIFAVFLFNMTMPITLTALANSLKLGKGFAFGLTTFALFLGTLPFIFDFKSELFNPFGLFGITAVSCLVLSAGLKLYFVCRVKQND